MMLTYKVAVAKAGQEDLQMQALENLLRWADLGFAASSKNRPEKLMLNSF